MGAMEVVPLAPQCGVEVRGVDLARLDDAGLGRLRGLLDTHGVVFFPEQDVAPEDHIALAERWAGIDVNSYFPSNAAWPQIAEVRKAETQTTNIGGGWHTDHSYDSVPAMGSILIARQTPPVGGDTLFANMAAAYDSLSDGLKATLETLRAVHSADHIYGAEGIYAKTDQAADLKGQALSARAVHPVVVRHPRTGRRILYVNPAFTLHFEGWTRAESMGLLGHLYTVGMREEFQCRVQWRPGAVAVWDNRLTWHCAMNDYQGHARLMHRITLSGEALH